RGGGPPLVPDRSSGGPADPPSRPRTRSPAADRSPRALPGGGPRRYPGGAPPRAGPRSALPGLAREPLQVLLDDLLQELVPLQSPNPLARVAIGGDVGRV